MFLDELRKRYPLARRWGEPTVFSDTVSVCGIGIHLAGLCVSSDDGGSVTGSAGDLFESPVERAYFELLERTSVVALSTSDGSDVPIRTADGERLEAIGHDVVAPKSGEPDRWRYARSNGVAAGLSWRGACARAEWELVERDCILRSWYGENSPVRTALPAKAVPQALDEVYSIEAYLFGSAVQSRVEVAGVFGFPKRGDAPMLYGFGARPAREPALLAAANECIQRLGFLWGEAIPSREPHLSPTAEFHQDFFMWPPAHDRIRRWLAGEHRLLVPDFAESTPAQRAERRFVDLTPLELRSKFFVAKALPDGEVPLVFGDGGPGALARLPAPLRIHPIC
jgi:hypothetical protein